MTAVPKLKHRMRGEIKRKHPASTYKQLVKELDRVFGLYIKKRDGNRCMFKGNMCRCGGVMQPNHLVSRANMRLRWDEKNVYCGCSAHNAYAHFNQIEFYHLWRKIMPLETIQYLDIVRANKKKYQAPELRIMIEHFKTLTRENSPK